MKSGIFRKIKNAFVLGTVLAASVVTTGCKDAVIDGIAYKIEPNLETVRIQLNFAKTFQADIGGVYPIKHYGSIFLNPSTNTTPFNVGFDFNMNVVYDNDYVKMEPTDRLPGGQLLPLPADAQNRAMVRVDAYDSAKFTTAAYIDVLGKQWLGTAVSLKFIGKSWPSGVVVFKHFLDSKVAAAFYGPKLNKDGSLANPGGVAIFANVRALIDSAKTTKTGTDKGKVFKINLAEPDNTPR